MSATHQTLPAAKPSAGLPDPGKQRRFPALRLLRHREMLLALASGALMCTAWGLHAWLPMLSVVLYITAYIVGGFVKAREGLATLFKDRDLDVNLLMIAAALGAASIGYWNEGAMLIFIFALSGALESFAGEQSRRDISALAAMKPETALRIDADGMKEVAAETLLVGDLVLVKPGEVIPADGIVSSGGSSVNQSAITGESMPVDKRAGDGVYAGTINGEGALYVEVTSPADGTLFAKIIALVEQAEREVPKTERFIKRLEGIYAKAVLLVTAALVLLAPLTFGWSWPAAFYKAMVFLVVASPCALVSSVMPAMLSAMSKSARNGVLFKGAAYMDLLGGARVVAFDKTGTLTEGIPEVTELYVAEGYDRLRVLAACAAAESLSEHPLAEAIVRKAEEEGLTIRSADELQALPGWGIEAKIGGEVWRVGKADEDDPNLPPEFAERMRAWIAEGHTVSAIQASGEYAGLISLRDRIRPQAKAAIDRLHRLGIAAAMLTGDRGGTARAVAREAGIDLVYGDLLPQDKVEHVKALRSRYGSVVMVGDGVNDAPALAAATVGVAMGGGGSAAALEVADVVLMNDSLERVAEAISLARRARRIVKQNLVFAGAVILLLIASNFLRGIPLPLGVVGHEGSTLLVILNGLRLLR
ncbi:MULTISPECIES: heavy metal translocating P-type ATPase [Paenibacillus]|uniref:Heavy metal translocating P-type ATPase n=3 Tax=Paenibacillus macerans TaxID=44252 RepID=A0A6N8EY53_PAEMA|nr:heavy metal translocating P-type ATPase [Paenibacillus macerans]MBS5913059.1 heavy metal translocating P-type ATPase [Paenibacillus macerans]MUG25136.1 heavy metal translocating P-type ATPase [Paenibacillus macerans]UMV47939.1 heavy metal translocating P-type ATPase [Paenibacillus macerans]